LLSVFQPKQSKNVFNEKWGKDLINTDQYLKKNNDSKILPVVKYALSFGLIATLITLTDLSEITDTIKKTNYKYLLIGLSLTSLSVLIRTYKWYSLLKVQGNTLPFGEIHSINYISLFFNNFFLGSIGGDAFRIHKTIKHSNQRSGAVSALIMDRATGIWMLAFIVLLSLSGFSVAERFFTHHQFYMIIGCDLAFLIISMIVFCVLPKKIYLKNTNKIISMFQSFLESFNVYRYHLQVVFLSLLLSCAFYIVNIFVMYIFSSAVDARIDLLKWALIVPVASFVSMIPISVNGLGIQEGAFFLFVKKMGVDSGTALLIASLPRIVMLLLSLFGGILYVTGVRKKENSTFINNEEISSTD